VEEGAIASATRRIYKFGVKVAYRWNSWGFGIKKIEKKHNRSQVATQKAHMTFFFRIESRSNYSITPSISGDRPNHHAYPLYRPLPFQ
jgi:hypothetical protein